MHSHHREEKTRIPKGTARGIYPLHSFLEFLTNNLTTLLDFALLLLPLVLVLLLPLAIALALENRKTYMDILYMTKTERIDESGKART